MTHTSEKKRTMWNWSLTSMKLSFPLSFPVYSNVISKTGEMTGIYDTIIANLKSHAELNR